MPERSDSSYLSMTELARRLDLPESTMRYYCKRFTKFLLYKGEGRRRRYAPEAEKTLNFIANAMHRNKNATAVELMLQSGQFTPVLSIMRAESPQAQPRLMAPAAQAATEASSDSGRLLLGVMERQAEALSRIAISLDNFVKHLSAQTEGSLPSGAAPSPAVALHREVLELKEQMFTAERVHQEDLEQLRKWMGHMGEAVARLNG